MRPTSAEKVVEVIELDASWEVVLGADSNIELEVAADSLGGPRVLDWLGALSWLEVLDSPKVLDWPEVLNWLRVLD